MDKINLTKTEVFEAIVLTDEEKKIIKYCLDYGWHRIAKHGKTGMSLMKKRLPAIDALRKQF